jgi:hypothetical protein
MPSLLGLCLLSGIFRWSTRDVVRLSNLDFAVGAGADDAPLAVLVVQAPPGLRGAGLVVPKRLGGRVPALRGARLAPGDLLEEVGGHEAGGARAGGHLCRGIAAAGEMLCRGVGVRRRWA